jgi:hypothetical protein
LLHNLKLVNRQIVFTPYLIPSSHLYPLKNLTRFESSKKLGAALNPQLIFSLETSLKEDCISCIFGANKAAGKKGMMEGDKLHKPS